MERSLDEFNFHLSVSPGIASPKGMIEIQDKFLFRESFMLFLDLFHVELKQIDFLRKRRDYQKWVNRETEQRRNVMIAAIKEKIDVDQSTLETEIDDISYLEQNIHLISERKQQILTEKNNYLATFIEWSEKKSLEREINDIEWNLENLEKTMQILESELSYQKQKFTPFIKTADPILTYTPDKLMFEMFENEGLIYKNMTLETKSSSLISEGNHGCSTIDLSRNVFSEIAEIQTDTKLHLKFMSAVETPETPVTKHIYLDPVFKKRKLLFNSCTFIPGCVFDLDPIDFYSIIALIRKFGKPNLTSRIRVDLIPKKNVKITLEPQGEIYVSRQIYNGDNRSYFLLTDLEYLSKLDSVLGITTRIRIKFIGTGFPVFFRFEISTYSLTIGFLPRISEDYSAEFVYKRTTAKKFNLPKVKNQFIKNILALKPKDYDTLRTEMGEFGDIDQGLLYLLSHGNAHFDPFSSNIVYRNLYPEYRSSENSIMTSQELKVDELISRIGKIDVKSKDHYTEIRGTIEETEVEISLGVDLVIIRTSCSSKHPSHKQTCVHRKALFLKYLASLEVEN